MNVGTRLKALRTFRKFSRETVAQRMNVTERQVYWIESRKDLNTKVIRAYCKALDMNEGVALRLGDISVRGEVTRNMKFLNGVRAVKRHWSVEECSQQIGYTIDEIWGYEIDFPRIVQYIEDIGGIIELRVDAGKVLKKDSTDNEDITEL
jgi:transcriptional regulator with XRE-family HTH domain